MITTPSQQTRTQMTTQTAMPLLALCLGYFMTILDVTIVNVALVNIKEQLSANVTGLQWIVDGYALAFALLATSLSGWFMPRIGTKRVMVIGLLLSALACFGFVLVDSQTSYVLLACLLAVLGFGLASVLPAMTESAISHAPRTQSGIASGMLNVSRQVGGVIGVAILGTLVGNQQTFLSGMHLAFGIAGGVLVLALGVAWVFVRTRQEPPQ